MGIKYVCDRCGCDLDRDKKEENRQTRVMSVQHLNHGFGFDMDLCDGCYNLVINIMLSHSNCKLHEFIDKKGKKK